MIHDANREDTIRYVDAMVFMSADPAVPKAVMAILSSLLIELDLLDTKMPRPELGKTLVDAAMAKRTEATR